MSQREWQRTDRTLFRAKNCDTFKPFGPSSADQIWDTATWIHEMSKTATLHPGDVRNPIVAET